MASTHQYSFDELFPMAVRQHTSDTVRTEVEQNLKTDLGEARCAHLLPKAWTGEISTETIDELRAWFERRVLGEASAGNVALFFARTVLAIIGSGERWNETRKRAVAELCTVIERRPFPTMLWADFVLRYLDSPVTISGILTGCVQNTRTLETRIRETVARDCRKLRASHMSTIFVFGYSATIVAALQGIPQTPKTPLRLVTPRLQLRKDPDGALLATAIEQQGIRAQVTVLDDEEALLWLRTEKPDLFLMGCKVIGRRLTGNIEVVNSRNAQEFVAIATAAGVRIAVVAGVYKLWSTQTYEKYRPLIVMEQQDHPQTSSVVRGALVSRIITEDGIYLQRDFRREYETCFSTEGVPLTSIRAGLSAREGSDPQKICDPRIQLIAAEVQRKQCKKERLPQHFIDAQQYYEQRRQDEEWLTEHLGKYVAIVGRKIIGTAEDFHDLASSVREEYGFGPLFMPLVTKEPRAVRLHPRVAETQEG